MKQVGRIFGFPVYVDSDLPRGEIALIGIREGFEVRVEDGQVVLTARRPEISRIVGLID